MNSTTAERVNLPMHESVRAESCDRGINFRARWQTAVATVSGYALRKRRLELAPSVSKFLGTSTHGSNDNDRSVNIVRPSYLSVSALIWTMRATTVDRGL
jgi:hypothetical protein